MTKYREFAFRVLNLSTEYDMLGDDEQSSTPAHLQAADNLVAEIVASVILDCRKLLADILKGESYNIISWFLNCAEKKIGGMPCLTDGMTEARRGTYFNKPDHRGRLPCPACGSYTTARYLGSEVIVCLICNHEWNPHCTHEYASDRSRECLKCGYWRDVKR